jgi:uncharacterized integral membrane protein
MDYNFIKKSKRPLEIILAFLVGVLITGIIMGLRMSGKI